MTQIKLENCDELSPIQKFYSGSKIFITGGTGFLGMILIEKLLRSCSDIETIYMLARAKKGKDVQIRIDELFDAPIFQRLRNEMPKFRHKVVAINGDCSASDLGINSQDAQILINEVNIVFHVAATVRFDEKLKTAVSINVNATKQMLKLAKKMPHLKSYIHVSTAYAYAIHQVIEEKFYTTPINATTIKLLTDENLPESIIDKMTPILLDKFPNTYAFTKAIAEDVVREEAVGMPVGLFRPSIVVSTLREPIPAWINNLYGPTGLSAGACGGIIRALYADRKCNANIIPVDMCVNAMIAQAWDVAANNKNQQVPPVMLYESSTDKPINWGTFEDLSYKYGQLVPCSKILWCYVLGLYSNYFAYCFAILFLHFIPAILMDIGLICTNKSPKMLKVYKKIHKFTGVLSYFSTKSWIFKSVRCKEMIDRMDEKDREIFFCDLRQLDWNEFFKSYILGIRIHLLQDPIETVPEAIKRYKKLIYLHFTVKMLVVFLVVRILWWAFSMFFL